MRSSDSTGKSGGHARRSADGSSGRREEQKCVAVNPSLEKSLLLPFPPAYAPRVAAMLPSLSCSVGSTPAASNSSTAAVCSYSYAHLHHTQSPLSRALPSLCYGWGRHAPQRAAAVSGTHVHHRRVRLRTKQRACSVRDKPVSGRKHKIRRCGLGVFFTWIQEKSSSIFPPWISDHIRVVTGVSAHSRLCSIAS